MSFAVRKLGIRLPIVYKQMGYDLVSTHMDEIKQNLKMILLTTPGEFPGDPDLGCGLQRKLFETISPNLSADLQQIILSQIAQYLPIIQIVNIAFETAAMYIVVKVKYYVPSLSTPEVLELKLRS